MMKKLLAMVLLLALLLGLTATAEVQNAYVGFWKLEKISLFGIDMTKDKLDWTMEIHIYSNGDCFLLKDGMIGAVKLQPYNGGYAMAADGEIVAPMSMGSNGLLHMTMAFEGIEMDCYLKKGSQPYGLNAVTKPYAGTWDMTSLALNGFVMNKSMLGDMGEMRIYETGYGILELEGDITGFKVVNLDSMVYMTDSAGEVVELVMSTSNAMTMGISYEGIEMNYGFERVAN